jgi:polyhydroxyalkanoate synthase
VTAPEVIHKSELTETVDGAQSIDVIRELLRYPGDIAVERTTPRSGPTRRAVILVHGFAQNRFTWRLSGRSLVARLCAEGFEVLNVELRGHGESRRLGSKNATEFGQYVQDLTAVIARCASPPFVIGHSLGGGVAVGAVTQVGGGVAGLVHLAGLFSFGKANPTIRALARMSLAMEPTLLRVRVRTGWVGTLLGRLYRVSDVAGYGFPIAGWAPGSMSRELLEERLKLGFDWTSIEVWLEMSRWATGEPFPYAAPFAKVDVPLLVLCGDADPLLPPADARVCYDRSGSSDRSFIEFEPFEHGGHWGHIDLILGDRAPTVVWPTLVQWLLDRDRSRPVTLPKEGR